MLSTFTARAWIATAVMGCLCLWPVPSHSESARVECAFTWAVDPPPPPARRPPTTIACHDGDACDADGDGGNGSCTFRIAACINNHDARGACTPTDTTTLELLKPDRNDPHDAAEDVTNAAGLFGSLTGLDGGARLMGICTNRPVSPPCLTNPECDSVPDRHDGRCYLFVRFFPPAVATDDCGAFTNVVVPLRPRRGGGLAAGAKRLRLRAANAAHVRDVDSLTLRCLPHL
jgi:hypothetical protein